MSPLFQAGRGHLDALKALCRAMLASGQLGSHNGLPVTMVVSTTLAELESGRGHAVTGGGSLLPMSEVIRQAAAAHHYLAVFDNHTAVPALSRAAAGGRLRVPSGSCCMPAIAAAPGRAARSRPITARPTTDDGWAAADSPTDIDKLSLACGPDNRLIEETGWTTRKRKDGRTEWIPPPQLDTGQARVNNYHHPQRYLIPDNDDDADDESHEREDDDDIEDDP